MKQAYFLRNGKQVIAQHGAVSINHHITTGKMFGKFLKAKNILRDDPFLPIKKLKTDTHQIKPFSESDVRKLLAQPDKSTFAGFSDYTIMLFLLDTGVRLRELLESIRVDDINWKNQSVFVMGKNRKERLVYFSKTTRDPLHYYVTDLRGECDHDMLWVGHDGRPYNRSSLHKRLRDYGLQARLKGVRVSPDTFRNNLYSNDLTPFQHFILTPLNCPLVQARKSCMLKFWCSCPPLTNIFCATLYSIFLAV